MKLPAKKTHTYYRYAAIYFAALFLISAILMTIALQFSASEMKKTSVQNAESNMQQAAELLDRQLQTMQDIALKVSMQIDYRPYRVKQGGVYDINLLERFKQYANYSPLAGQYFLVYKSVRKIYTSAGTTSYFNYYAPYELNMSYELTSEVLERILAAERPYFELSDDAILAVFPVRFSGYTESRAYHAMLCFVLTEKQLQDYIAQTTAAMPEGYEVAVNGATLFRVGETERTGESLLSVSSADGKVTVGTGSDFSGWRLLFAHGGWVIAAGIAVSLLLAVASALTMAHYSLRPLDRLLQKYALGNEETENEFEQLDSILQELEQSKTESVQQLRNQLLLQLLHGDYSDRMLRRCAVLGLSFTFPYCCVCLMEHEGTANPAQACRARLKALANEERNVYVAEMDEERLAAIVNDGSENVREKLGDAVRAIAGECGCTVFIGQTVEGAKRLPISYMTALTERRVRRTNEKARVRSCSMLAGRLIDAVSSGDEALQAQTAEETRAYLSEEPLSGVMTRFYVYELAEGICKAAEDRGIDLERAEVHSLAMLSDPTVIVQDLIRLLRRAGRAAEPPRCAPDTTARVIAEYVFANAYDPDLDLQKMSEQFGLSADYISNMIKRETGYAFKEYVTILRITEAQRLLSEEKNLTINEIAAMVGYRKSSNFSKKFKELTGVLPSQFRM